MSIPRTQFDSSAELGSRTEQIDGLFSRHRFRFVVWVAALLVGTPGLSQGVADRPNSDTAEAIARSELEASDKSGSGSAADRQRYALIVVGLAGDEEHKQRFQTTVGLWRDWLVQRAAVKEDQLTILSGNEDEHGVQLATAEAIRAAAADLTNRAREQDSVWVFLIGHGSQDRSDGWFHLPGADLSAADWADLFVPLQAGEQVFWLTHSASGSFLKPMSRPGRIVITATDPDGEVNETRFPHALAEVMQREVADSPVEEVAAPRGPTLLGLFQAAARDVRDSFERDELVPTEHARLDDNGDGVGAEVDELDDTATVQSAEPVPGGNEPVPGGNSGTAEESVPAVETIDESGAPVDGLRAGQTPIELTTLIPPRRLTCITIVAAASSRSWNTKRHCGWKPQPPSIGSYT